MSADPQMEVADSVSLFLLLKPPVRLIGKTCQSPRTNVARMAGHTAHGAREISEGHCTRPMWGDGRVDGEHYGLCSQCWHEHNAFHGHYVTMQANPAAAKLDAFSIKSLTFGATLPDVGAHQPDTFPADWL